MRVPLGFLPAGQSRPKSHVHSQCGASRNCSNNFAASHHLPPQTHHVPRARLCGAWVGQIRCLGASLWPGKAVACPSFNSCPEDKHYYFLSLATFYFFLFFLTTHLFFSNILFVSSIPDEISWHLFSPDQHLFLP